MALYIVIGMLAAFGTLCAVWAVLGWILPGSGGVLRYSPNTAEDGLTFAGRYLWLKNMGLLRCTLVIADTKLDETEKRWLNERGILLAPEPENGIGAESN